MHNYRRQTESWAAKALCILALCLMGCASTFTKVPLPDTRGGVVIPSRGTIANPGRFKALLIANEKYEKMTSLKAPLRDVKTLASVLKKHYRFEVEIVQNLPTTKRMYEVIKGFLLDDVEETDSLLVYYAGHGIKDEVLRTGFWVPTGAKGTMHDSFRTGDLAEILAKTKALHGLVISDSCFSGRLLRSGSSVSSHRNTYATAYKKRSFEVLTSGADEPVPDEGANGHSPFAHYLIRHLKNPAKDTFSVNEFVGLMETEIRNLTGKGVVPLYSPKIPGTFGDDGGKFVFFRKRPKTRAHGKVMTGDRGTSGRPSRISLGSQPTRAPVPRTASTSEREDGASANGRIQLSFTLVETDVNSIEKPQVFYVIARAKLPTQESIVERATSKPLAKAMKRFLGAQKVCRAATRRNIKDAEAQQKLLKKKKAAWKRSHDAGMASQSWDDASQALRAKLKQDRTKWRAALEATCGKATTAQDELATRIVDALPKPGDTRNTVTGWFWVHLADNHARRADEANFAAQEQFDRQFDLFDQGKLPKEPQEPPTNPDYGEALKTLERFLVRFKTHPARAWAIYLKAHYLDGMDSDEAAIQAYWHFIRDFPKHPLAAEVQLRIGDHYFELGGSEIRVALEAYRGAIQKDEQSKHFDMILYKMAWAAYRLVQLNEASQWFADFVVRKKDHLLIPEAVQYLGIIACEQQSTEALFASELPAKHKAEALDTAAKCALDTGDVLSAVQWYQHALTLNPLNTKALKWEEAILHGLDDLGELAKLKKRAESLFARYGLNSAWYQTNRTKEKPQFLSDLAKQQGKWIQKANARHQQAADTNAAFVANSKRLLSGTLVRNFTRCYAKVLHTNDPSLRKALSGTLQFQLDWNAKGDVVHHTITSDTVGNAELNECVENALSHVKNLPRKSGGTDIDVTFE